jgi:L-cysteine:1D-myo-inositol 2-amino-2-deoxy-alpha-D-glucopyranoside ligase
VTAWPAPAVPAVPGRGLPVRVFDTARGELRDAFAGSPERGEARLYVCGITPYDATHLGHAATYVAFDLLYRAWLDAGLSVHYVQNVTDVDDPLLERAEQTGQDWRVLAKSQIDLFFEDMTALSVLPPREYVGAVEAIPLVVAAVEKLLESGAAYRVEGHNGQPDGDVYFSVRADPAFGAVSHLGPKAMTTLFGERGGDPDRPGKRDPLDCLLWRVERPGEPSWPGASLGEGRPGWHIECSAIALDTLGMSIDVQGGGRDLVFPHHEMGAGEAQVLTGRHPYAHNYVHAGMVRLDGEKMSKSLGNLELVSRLRARGVEPAAIRLAILAHHYRTDWDWSPGVLESAVTRLEHWRAAFSRESGPEPLTTLAAVRERLADDLDAPGALAAIDAWADTQLSDDAGDTTREPGAPGVLARAADALLGVRF